MSSHPTLPLSHRSRRRMVLCGAVAAMVVLSVPGTADAHNAFESSSPSPDEVVAASPPTWTLDFTSPVPLESASGEVVLADGSRLDLDAPVHGASDRSIVFTLPAALAGSVTARWRLVGTDGHVISGRVPFTVGQSPAVVQPTATSLPVEPDASAESGDAGSTQREALRVALRIAGYLALLAVGGVLFAEFYVAQGTTTLMRARMALRWGAVGLAIVPLGQLLLLAADLRGTSVGASTSGLADALDTTAGVSLALRIVIGLALAALLTARLRRSRDSGSLEALISAVCAAYLVAMVMVGHSRSMPLPWLGVPLGAVHGAAAAVWLGGLVVLVTIIVPNVTSAQSMTAFHRFSWAAQSAVAALVATGVGQALRIHGLPDSVLGSAHGRLLLAKVALVGAMVVLGAANRRRLAQRVDSGAAQTATRRRIVASSLVEGALGLIVVAVTSVLADASPDADR